MSTIKNKYKLLHELIIMEKIDGFAIKKQGSLIVKDFGGHGERNESTQAMIQAAVSLFQVPDFDWIIVNTGDHSIPQMGEVPIYSYSTKTREFETCCPDFVFHKSGSAIPDYEQSRLWFRSFNAEPKMDVLGWRGAFVHPSRWVFISRCSDPWYPSFSTDQVFDCSFIQWEQIDPTSQLPINWLSLEDQIRNWRFHIDIEGAGYSGRLKLLLSSPRVVLVQKRPFEEFFFEELIPWVHYVPVERDFSDLTRNLEILRGNPSLESTIIHNARQFADQHLTRYAALQRWAVILEKRSCDSITAAA